MSGKRILVTGANGYIGRHVVKALKARNAYIVSVDRNPNPNSLADCQIIGDIFDTKFDFLDGCDFVPNCCLHLAWRNGFNHNDFSHMEDLPKHFSFLKNVAESGIGQIAVMGSMHEVGYWEGAISQDTPCRPQSLYGIAKNALREALFAEFDKTDEVIQWLRGYYIFGDDIASQSIFGKILRAAEDGKESFPFTSGQNLYDFISVSGLAEMIASAILQDEVSGIINCCSGKPISLAQAVEAFIRENNLKIKLDYGAFPDRPYDSPGVWGDASLIKLIMGLS